MNTTYSKTPIRDFFLYLLLLIALYVSVGNYITLLFQYINELWPDAPTGIYGAALDLVRTNISILLVMFPLYLGLTWFLRKDMIAHPEKREFSFRKFVVYLTLFLAAVSAIVDLIVLINNFLNGELTMHFVMKVIVVLIVAGAVFAYYYWDLKRSVVMDSRPSRSLLAIACVVVFGSVIAGFFVIGSPWNQRLRRLDDTRVSDLQSIQYEIINLWSRTNELPQNLSTLKDNVSGYAPPLDPDSGKPYEFNVKGPLSFELCADFALKSEGISDSNKYRYPPYPMYNGDYSYGENWEHEAGRICFERVLDPKKHKLPQQPY